MKALRLSKYLIVPALLLAAGCSTSNIPFNRNALSGLQSGVTTLEQINERLGAAPVQVYRQPEGPFMARWEAGTSFIPNALYWRQEIWIDFDAAGRYRRIVNEVNMSKVQAEDADSKPMPSPVRPLQQDKTASGGALGSIRLTPIEAPSLVLPMVN